MSEPQNPFEESLVRAISEPEHRSQFYRDFLAADLYVALHGPAPPLENGTLKPGTGVHIQGVEAGGKTYLAVFSSLPRLRTFFDETATLRLACRDLLEMTRGAELMLNPGSEYGKEFVAEEIAGLLDGSMFQGRRHTIESPAQVLLGQPANYPRPLADALRRVYERKPEVQAAYVAWMVDPGDPGRGEAGALLVAVETAGEWDALSIESGAVAQGFAQELGPVDFVQLEPEGSLWRYFRGVKPFYRRSVWRSLFSR